MQQLEERILRDGIVKDGGILKVDSFLNHQMDIALFERMGQEFRRLFAGSPVTKILTIEASGIGIACIAARYFGVPVIYAKKTKSMILDGEFLTVKVESFTKKICYDIMVAKRYLSPQDHVLIIDDFLAKGNALAGLINIVKQAGAQVTGCGIAIEKGFQNGGKRIRETGIRLESLAIVESMENGVIRFQR